MSELIFVTGASGFLASHIIYQLIRNGYRVRGSARGKKVNELQALYASTPAVEIVEISNISYDQFPEALKGVDAVIHTASPLAGREEPEELLKTAIQGSLNVLCQGEKAGIKRFIVTSSLAAVVRDPRVKGTAYRAEHWNPVTKEDIATTPALAYPASKKYAELAVWEWAEAHPHVDVTTINPPFLYGPFAPLSLPIAPGDFSTLSTNLSIYNLITPGGAFPGSPGYADIRDVARVHVGALRSAPAGASVATRKRILVASPHGNEFKDLVETIRKERPQISSGEGDRLTKTVPPQFPYDRYDLDFARIEELTGVKKEEFHALKQTFLDVIDDILELEKTWVAKGYTVTNVPLM